jgi:hypothetical protein
MTEPEIQLSHTSQLGELAKEEVYRSTDAFIWLIAVIGALIDALGQ